MAKKTTRKKTNRKATKKTTKRATKRRTAKKAAKRTTKKATRKTTKKAKKASRKAAKRPAKKATKRSTKKTTKKKSAPRKKTAKRSAKKTAKKAPARKKAARGPRTISTGRGPGPKELGAELVKLFNKGTDEEVIWKKLASPRLVSIEGMGMAFDGLPAVRAKAKGFYEQFAVRGAVAEGPYTGATSFAVKFRIDVEDKATGDRRVSDEIGVYTVRNGKIVQEEFMYGP